MFRIIQEEKEYKQVPIYNGGFRHWDHPFIDYVIGLRKLYAQVTVKVVDEQYAKALASDLAYIVFKHEFDKKVVCGHGSFRLSAPSSGTRLKLHMANPCTEYRTWETLGTICRSSQVGLFGPT